MTILFSSALEPAPSDDRAACAEALLEAFALLWLGTSRSKVTWEPSDWAFEELCNGVLLWLKPAEGS